jgi:hypothetical protein
MLFALIGGIINKSHAQCDSSLWRHVYHSYRLGVNTQCMTVTGTVYSLIYEADGDIHIRVTLDPAFTYMLNADNYSGQRGKLVCEPICATTVTQTDAIAPCMGLTNTVYIPAVGERVWVTGSYVTDHDHGWNEIHPVTSILLTDPSLAVGNVSKKTEVAVYPVPANNYVNFKLSEEPGTPLYITILDGLGRLAGQYQMLKSLNLNVKTTYLPSGVYYYHIEQDGKYLKGGSFEVAH